MGGVVSGAALPALADRVVSATAGPYVTALVLGGHWGVSFALFAAYHFLFAATNGWSPAANRTLYEAASALQADVGTANAYFIILPALALGCAVLGWFHARVAFAPRFLPRHAFPASHCTETDPAHRLHDDPAVPGAADARGLAADYVVAATIGALLTGLASWLPYEMTVLFAPDGGASLWAPIVGCVVPVVAVTLFILVPWALCGPRSGVFRRKSGALRGGQMAKAWLLVAAMATAFAAAPALTAYFTRDFDWTWTAAAIAAAVLGLGAGLAGTASCGALSSAAAAVPLQDETPMLPLKV